MMTIDEQYENLLVLRQLVLAAEEAALRRAIVAYYNAKLERKGRSPSDGS